MICSFFGHREIEITDELKERLRMTIVNLIENKDVDTFYFGGFGMFDNLCWQMVSELKKTYTHIQRLYVCDDYKYINRPHKRPKWLCKDDYEEFIYLDMEYRGFYGRIYFRNCEMIKSSDCIIFYIRNTEDSGAYKALKFAKRKKKHCILL